MKLIGSFGSPYTRRVAITLKLYGLDYQMHKRGPFGEEKAKLREYNPLGRVPILVRSNGESLVESSMILDYLDSLVEAEKRLTPMSGEERWTILNYASVASGATDKLVSTLYEFHFRPKELIYKPWVRMCDQQVADSFQWLNNRLKGRHFVGDRLTQADVSIAVFWQFGRDKRQKFFDRMNCSAIQALSDRLAETDEYQATPSEGGLPEGIALG